MKFNFFATFLNQFSALLLKKINVLDILNMLDSSQVFVIPQTTEIIIELIIMIGYERGLFDLQTIKKMFHKIPKYYNSLRNFFLSSV